MRRLGVAAAAWLAAGVAAAEPARPRPPRWSVGSGGALLLAGAGEASRLRADLHAAVSPGGRFGRFGLVAALRQVVLSPVADDALLTLGVRYEAAASRPRLALALHGDLGATLGGAPALGGGIETTLWVAPRRLGPVALVFDVTAHLLLDGIDDTRLAVAAATRLSLAR